MPPWAEVSPNLDLVCRLHQRLSDVCDVQEIDIIVVGIFHQVCQLIEAFLHEPQVCVAL